MLLSPRYYEQKVCRSDQIKIQPTHILALLAYNAESPKERKAKWEELAEEAATFAKKHSMSDSSILPLYLMWVRALSMGDGESAASLMKEETRRQFVKEHGKENREGLLGSVLLYCGDAYLHHGMRHQASKMFRKFSQINEKSLMLTESSVRFLRKQHFF